MKTNGGLEAEKEGIFCFSAVMFFYFCILATILLAVCGWYC